MLATSFVLYFYLVKIKKLKKGEGLYNLPLVINVTGCYFISDFIVKFIAETNDGAWQIRLAIGLHQIALAWLVYKTTEKLLYEPEPAKEGAED